MWACGPKAASSSSSPTRFTLFASDFVESCVNDAAARAAVILFLLAFLSFYAARDMMAEGKDYFECMEHKTADTYGAAGKFMDPAICEAVKVLCLDTPPASIIVCYQRPKKETSYGKELG